MTLVRQDYSLGRFWLALGLLGCGVLTYACLMPHPPQPQVANFDKFEHFAAFALLSGWFGNLLAPRYGRVIILMILFGAFIEIAQSFTPYRSADMHDLMADSFGVLAGVTLARFGAMRWLGYLDARVATKADQPR
ncbi:hypothetical protein T5B8_10031 [Salinisphaera sp. T5B8]|uniref:VanZ family protein n=1 Tax=Salinisphaera sp. T5B8 TaxID=1304154 RepID=UPI003340391A